MNSDGLIQLLTVALMGKTAANNNVYGPSDWPTATDLMPVLLIQTPHERKDSLGRNAPAFNTVTTARIVGRVTSAADAGDAGARAVVGMLGIFVRQVERAVINNYDLTKAIQQFLSVETVTKVSADGKQHIGEFTMDIAMEFFQGVEEFAPVDANPLEEVALYGDLINVFDPSGTYPNPPFPDAVTSAPRSSGPDGRAEAALDIQLEQP